MAGLVKKLDEAAEANKSAKLGSFVVLLSDDDKAEPKVKEFGEKAKVKKVVLGIDNVSGPDGYDIAKDADVTVVLYVKKKVAKTFAFKKGELADKDVTAIVDSLKDILPKK